jgi:lipoteichoic acid synthase
MPGRGAQILGRAVGTAGRAYGRQYGAAMRQPLALLAGQLITFFGVSLYVKLVQMRLTPEYAGAWRGSGQAWTNCIHAILFCGQEIGVFAALATVLAVWWGADPGVGVLSRWAARGLGFVVLPALSAIEVLGLAHYAFFLTPLGPEEVRTVVWAPMIVSSSNVLQLPQVLTGLVLVVLAYHVIPLALWPRGLRVWERCRLPHLVALMLAGVIAAACPKPIVADAMLAPHPLLWMLFGNRLQPAWAESADTGAGNVLAGHVGFRGRRRFSVKQRPTNVVILILESTRAASVALYNHNTPAGRQLLRFADETVVFDHIYAPVPTSAHAIFSIFYGSYPYLGPFWSANDKSVVADSMAQLFGRAGYDTQLSMTSDLNFDNVRSYAATGFDRVLDTNEWPGQEAYALLPWGRDDRLLIEETKRFMTAHGKGARRNKPFFLVAMTSNPHHPYAADQLFADAPQGEDRGSYERLVDYDLGLVADLYEWMKQRGVAERTLLLVLGDHGEAFGEHAGNYGHAAFIYDENVHIPCFILHPHRLGLPRHIEQLGSQVDLRATIVDILGLSDPGPGDGMSLLREDPERLVANFTENGVTRFGVRDARFSYIYTPHVNLEQVFDRRNDPGETRNIAAREPVLTARYRTRLQRWEAQHQLTLARILR